MKVTTKTLAKPTFAPVQITITIESEKELNDLCDQIDDATWEEPKPMIDELFTQIGEALA